MLNDAWHGKFKTYKIAYIYKVDISMHLLHFPTENIVQPKYKVKIKMKKL